jgi:hypothetical protein
VASLVDVVIVIENYKKVGGRRSYVNSVIKPESAQGVRQSLEWFQSRADIRQDSKQRSGISLRSSLPQVCSIKPHLAFWIRLPKGQ